MVTAAVLAVVFYLVSLTLAGSGVAAFALGLMLQAVAFVLVAYLIVEVTS